MRYVLGGLLWVLLLGPSLVCSQTCTYNNTVLTGSTFELAGVVDPDFNCEYAVYLFKQHGALYSLPELRVVANTTVTFNLTSTVGILAFGLTLSSVSVSSGDALGLTPTPDSVSAGACRAFPELAMANNTFAHNRTARGVPQYTAQPCVLTWLVPLPNTNNNYSYFVYESPNASPPRRIYIVNSTDVPSSSSSGAASASSSSSSFSSVVPGPSSSSSSSSSSVFPGPSSSSSNGTGTGSSSTPITDSSSTGTGSSSSLSSSSIGTSSSSSSSSTPNGAGVNGAGAAVAVIVAVMWTLVSA